MRTKCLDAESAVNFANLFWIYNYPDGYVVPDPYRFLGYLYFRVDLKPWEYDCDDLFEGLVYHMLSGENEYEHNPFMNPAYYPEKDPAIISEALRLRNEDAGKTGKTEE